MRFLVGAAWDWRACVPAGFKGPSVRRGAIIAIAALGGSVVCCSIPVSGTPVGFSGPSTWLLPRHFVCAPEGFTSPSVRRGPVIAVGPSTWLLPRHFVCAPEGFTSPSVRRGPVVAVAAFSLVVEVPMAARCCDGCSLALCCGRGVSASSLSSSPWRVLERCREATACAGVLVPRLTALREMVRRAVWSSLVASGRWILSSGSESSPRRGRKRILRSLLRRHDVRHC
mmetsp:Transcript_10786/g.28297  ORF Transcript_10786/g.28297 Transcript_10786/m.28297 type:complete len:227 (-) Transcript_10786:64-744(-)